MPTPGQPAPAPSTATPTPNPDQSAAAAQISTAIGQLKAAQQSGDFAAQGQALQALDPAVQRYQQTRPAIFAKDNISFQVTLSHSCSSNFGSLVDPLSADDITTHIAFSPPTFPPAAMF